jgi:hypothetical protein
LTAAARIETAREMLQKHQHFLIDDLFYEFDATTKGYVTAEDLQQGIQKYNTRRPDIQRFMDIVGPNSGGLTRVQLRDAVLPAPMCLKESARSYSERDPIRDE